MMVIKSWDGFERRNFEENGLGRRPYDMHCPFYDSRNTECREIEKVKKEINKKLPVWVFNLFALSLIGLIGVFLTLGWSAFSGFNQLSKKMNTAIYEVRESVVEIKINQRNLLDEFGIHRKSDRSEKK